MDGIGQCLIMPERNDFFELFSTIDFISMNIRLFEATPYNAYRPHSALGGAYPVQYYLNHVPNGPVSYQTHTEKSITYFSPFCVWI